MYYVCICMCIVSHASYMCMTYIHTQFRNFSIPDTSLCLNSTRHQVCEAGIQIVTPRLALSLHLHSSIPSTTCFSLSLSASTRAFFSFFFSLPEKFTTPAGTAVAATFREMAAFKGWPGDLRLWGFAARVGVGRKRGERVCGQLADPKSRQKSSHTGVARARRWR